MKNSTPNFMRSSQSGIALLIVLSLMILIAFIALHLMIIGRSARLEAFVTANRQELRYDAESATAQARWLLICDRKKYRSRNLGKTTEELMNSIDISDEDSERWMTDSREHTIELEDKKMVVVTLNDANSGFSCAGSDATVRNNLRNILKEQRPTTADSAIDFEERTLEDKELIDTFLDILSDYLDRSESLRLKGKEQEEYAEDGFPDLPRDGSFQYREELFWIDHAAEVLKIANFKIGTGDNAIESIQIIPPKGLSFSSSSSRRSSSTRPSFFSSSPAMIKTKANLDDQELHLILQAREQFWKDDISLDESLEPDLLVKIKRLFSFQESGIVTISATANSANSEVIRRTRTTCDCRDSSLRIRNDAPFLRNWEKKSF